jgi:transposase
VVACLDRLRCHTNVLHLVPGKSRNRTTPFLRGLPLIHDHQAGWRGRGLSLVVVPEGVDAAVRSLPRNFQRLGLHYERRPASSDMGGPQSWERYGLKPWIEAAKKRLHRNVLAIALANKLARIAWAVLNKERNFECVRTRAASSQPA